MDHNETIGENIAGRIARAFTFNRPLSIMVVLSIIIAGATMYMLTPKQYNPEIIRPAFQVVVDYPGARADEVEKYVTLELVEKIQDLSGIDEITARSIDGGRAEVTVIFDVGEDLEASKVKLFSQMQQHLDLIKGSMSEPSIQTIHTDDVPILVFAFRSDAVSQNVVRDGVIEIMNELKTIPGVANLQVHGGQERALTIVLDLDEMRAKGVVVSDVVYALEATNIKQPTGGIKDGTRVIALDVDSTVKNAEEAKEIVVGEGIFLGDIARIEDGYAEKSSFVFFNSGSGNDDAVYLSIAKRAGENAPAVSQLVHDRLGSIVSQEQYSSLVYDTVRDDGAVAQKEILGLGSNLITSIVIVGIVLVLFLSIRPALVVMIAIPMTLLLVFIAGYLFDQTINRITLFALILSLGLLVDSATVVVENMYRHVQRSPKEREHAIVHAVHQVGVGLILSAVTSIVVFLPMNYITGMMGPYMGPIAFFVPVSLAMSLLVAFVVTPFLGNIMLKKPKDGEVEKIPKTAQMFETLAQWYADKLKTILYNERLQKVFVRGFFTLLIIVMLFPVVKLVHFQMLPKADKDQYYIYIDMKEGTDVLETKQFAESVQTLVHTHPEVVSTQLFVAEAPVVDFNGLFKGSNLRSSTHMATIKVNVSPADMRKESSSQIVSETRNMVSGPLVFPEGASVRFVEDPPGPPVQATFVARVQGSDESVRDSIVHIIEDVMRGVPGVVDIDTSIEHAQPRLVVDIDTQKARLYGVLPQHVADTLGVVLGPVELSQYHLEGIQEFSPVELSVARNARDTVDDIDKVDVRSSSGTIIPLSSIATYEYSRTIPVRYSEDLEPTAYVTAETDDRSIVYVVIDAMSQLYGTEDEYGGKFVDWRLFGMTYETASGELYDIEWGGEWEMTLENFRDLGLAMIVAFALVFGILVAQYRSFLMPGLIMTTVPFGLVGILPGFALLDVTAGVYLTATALIGFIALIGIVVNNAILYLEYFTDLKERGGKYADDREALIEAGKVRMRPIVLTSLTTVLASITIAGDPVWSGLAWAIVFGLSLSAVMTLFVFPILYTRFKK
jgi:multidrug efflux pump subunit AcrB